MTIEKLILAGKKATQDKLLSQTNSGTVYDAVSYQDLIRSNCCGNSAGFYNQEDADFFVEAANNRAAVEAMFEENKRLREYCEEMKTALKQARSVIRPFFNGDTERYREELFAVELIDEDLKGGEE